MAEEQAQALIAQIGAEFPEILDLAERVCFAVRVDPGLLRRMRRKFLSGWDAGLEADLWFSPLVRFRTAKGIVFLPEVADLLRAKLAQRPEDYEATWQVTKVFHQPALSPAIFLEEEIGYLQYSRRPGAQNRIRQLIRSALAALVLGDERQGLVQWAARALPRFPSEVQALEETKMLSTETHLRLDSDLFADDLLPAGPLPDWVSSALPTTRISVALRLFPDYLEIGDTRTMDDAESIELPRTDPLVLELSWEQPQDAYDYDIFVSYSHQDRKAVEQFMRPLEDELGMRLNEPRIFMDTLSIAGGENWSRKLKESLEKSRSVLAVVSRASLASKQVQHEWQMAADRERAAGGSNRIIPLILEDVDVAEMPAWLQQIKGVDFRRRAAVKATKGSRSDSRQIKELSETVARIVRNRPFVTQSVTFQPGETRRVAVGSGSLRVKTLLGRHYELNRIRMISVVLPDTEDPRYEELYRQIENLCRDHGFQTRRPDPWKETAGIKPSTMMVADLSETDPNVYYQVGYAEGLGKPIVLTVREGMEPLLDLRSMRIIFYPELSNSAFEKTLRLPLEKFIRELDDQTTPFTRRGAEDAIRYYESPARITKLGRMLEPKEFAAMLTQLQLGEVLVGLYRDVDGRLIAAHLTSARSIKQMAAGGALVEGYFALPRAEADKGFKPPLSPPSLYTIMPFDESNEDLFYYSIQSAGKKFGLQVERADPSDFTGDIISQIFNRISDAELIVADLSHSNPNIYYELGFAVALQKRVILSAKSETRLPYVVQGQHRIEYDSIPDHQDQLLQEIEKVMAGGTR